MAQIAVGTEFMSDFSQLEKSVGDLLWRPSRSLPSTRTRGFTWGRSPTARTSDQDRQIDQFWRGIVFAPESDDTYCMLKVLPHEKAYEYAASYKLSVNRTLGVIEVRDAAAIEQIQPALERAATLTDTRLFANVSDADLATLGIDENTLMIARLLMSEAHLDAMQKMIPDVQYSVLVGLASGQTPEEVWAEVSQYAPEEQVDTSNVVKAMERTPGRVVFVKGNDELEKILEHPFAKWRVFLHPAQRKIAYAQRYSGPVQVTGGAGTGRPWPRCTGPPFSPPGPAGN